MNQRQFHQEVTGMGLYSCNDNHCDTETKYSWQSCFLDERRELNCRTCCPYGTSFSYRTESEWIVNTAENPLNEGSLMGRLRVRFWQILGRYCANYRTNELGKDWYSLFCAPDLTNRPTKTCDLYRGQKSLRHYRIHAKRTGTPIAYRCMATNKDESSRFLNSFAMILLHPHVEEIYWDHDELGWRLDRASFRWPQSLMRTK